MLQRLRQHLVLLLIVLLPFHALLVTIGTKLLAGSGHAPLPWLAVWKEGVVAVIFVVGIVEMGRRVLEYWNTGIFGIGGDENSSNRGEWMKHMVWRGGLETILISLMLVIAFILLVFGRPASLTQFAFGFKYLFAPIIFFLLLSRLEWEEDFLQRRIFPALLIVGGIVSLYGIITYFLPMGFFTALGYSDAHSLYAPGSSLSAFQQIGESGIRRIQSTFSGPNQLGMWLLIPWSVCICWLFAPPPQPPSVHQNDTTNRYREEKKHSLSRVNKNVRRGGSSFAKATEDKCLLFCLLLLSALLLTFSRSAWIAAFVITVVAGGVMLRGKKRLLVNSLLVNSLLVGLIIVFVFAPQLVLRGISNKHHFERTVDGIRMIAEYPFGLGLGTAGPASNRVSDACLYFDAGADISWAKDRNDLCLFVDGTQVQPNPVARSCTCPLLPENWYVQVGVEVGVIGLVLFLGLVMFVIQWLVVRRKWEVLLMFVGVSIAALFLHAWEDSAVAYTVWGLVGIVLSEALREKRGKIKEKK